MSKFGCLGCWQRNWHRTCWSGGAPVGSPPLAAADDHRVWESMLAVDHRTWAQKHLQLPMPPQGWIDVAIACSDQWKRNERRRPAILPGPQIVVIWPSSVRIRRRIGNESGDIVCKERKARTPGGNDPSRFGTAAQKRQEETDEVWQTITPAHRFYGERPM